MNSRGLSQQTRGEPEKRREGNVLAIAIQDAITKYGERVRGRGESPAAKAEDASDAGQIEQAVELVLGAADVDLPASRDVGKGPMDVRVVVVALELRDVHVQARTLLIPRLKVGDALDRSGRVGVVGDVVAAVGDAPVGPRH